MKRWAEKLIQQFDFDWSKNPGGAAAHAQGMSEDRATLLFVLDILNKHLIEIEGHPVRQVREQIDGFARELVNPQGEPADKVLFRFRQWLAQYRIEESAYLQKTFEEFRTIVWDFVDQLAEDMSAEAREDREIKEHLDLLKDAVETNSIAALKSESRKFIDCYMEKQFTKDKRRNSRMKSIRKNLNVVKKQLTEAQTAASIDHLTQALNRKSFDDAAEQQRKLFHVGHQPVTLMMVDIDYFKRINDTFGHAIGDFVLKELVKTLKSMFNREGDVLARIGGEEFAILLPDFQIEHAIVKAEEVLAKVRNEVFVHDSREIRFTVSIGLAQLTEGEDVSSWLKRADDALYNSKNTGRNRLTAAPAPLLRIA